jgi:hypothetical protein
MHDAVLHYELPGRIGNSSLGTESVDEVVERLQLLREAVIGTSIPTRSIMVDMGWYARKDGDRLPEMTAGVHILSADRYFGRLVSSVITQAGLPDYVSIEDYKDPAWLMHTAEEMTKILGKHDAEFKDEPQQARLPYAIVRKVSPKSP